MKRLKSNARRASKKYSRCAHVEYSGVGTRQLSPDEIAEFQARVDSIKSGLPHPIRLKVPA